MFIVIVAVSILAMTALLGATGGYKDNGLSNLLKGRWQAGEVISLLFAGVMLGGGVGVVLAFGILKCAH